jgi:hypothetical protein
MVLNVPDQVRQENQKCDRAAGEDPRRKQNTALARQENTGKSC